MEIKLNMENLTEQERDTLLGLVEKANKQKVWKPKEDEQYYKVSSGGSVYSDKWICSDIDNERYAIGNCFKTYKDAEFAVEKLKVIAELRRFAEEHNEGKIDWGEYCSKYMIIYGYSSKALLVDASIATKYNNVYFTSKTIAQRAIAAIGADRLKKYYFEVED